MANKKISELESRASLSLSDLMAVGDPSTGYLYKTTISDLKTLTGAGVVSFNGRFGTVNPAEGDYTLTQLGDVIITTPSNAQVLQYNGSNWVNSSLNLTTTLAALTDVAISSIANNQLLRYNSTSQKWENWTPNYLTAESDTLNSVTGRGNTTANSITVGSVSAAGLSNLLGEIRTFATTGNTYIGANPTSASDAGYKLDLNGTARISGDMTMWDDGTNNGNSRALIFRALGSTGNAQTGQILLDGFGASGQDYLQISASNLRLAPTSGTVTITGTTPSISTVAASGFRFTANSTTNGFIFTQSYNQTSGDLFAVFTNSNQKKLAVNFAGVMTVADLSGTGSRMVVADANGVLSTQAIPTSAVSSVFGRTGAVVAANGDYTTSQVTEGSNLYYTDARSRAAITLTTSGSSGAATYSGGTLNIPTYTLAGLGGQPALSGTGFVKISGTTISYDNSTYLTTSSAASTYLPLSGGTLTGALNGTSASFSGDVSGRNINAQDGFGLTAGNFQVGGISGNRFYIYNGTLGIDNITISPSTGVTTFYRGLVGTTGTFSSTLKTDGVINWNGTVGALSYGSGFVTMETNSATQIRLVTNGTAALTLATNQAATFSSSVTAGGIIYSRSANYPQIVFQETTSSTDALIFYDNVAATKNLGFRVNSASNVMTLTSTNVGINTTAPTAPLTVAGTTDLAWSASTSKLQISRSGTVARLQNYDNGSVASLSLQWDGGNVGVGTVNPARMLHILYPSYIGKDTVQGIIRLTGQSNEENSGTVLSGGTSLEFYNKWTGGEEYSVGRISGRASQGYAGGLQFDVAPQQAPGQSNFLNAMVILRNGNVGIGISTPSYTFDVNKSVAGDFVARIANSSSTGFGLYVQANDNTKAGIRIANASGGTAIDLFGSGAATFTGDVKVKTLEITNVGTDAGSSGLSTYMRITVNGQNYLIPLHGTP